MQIQVIHISVRMYGESLFIERIELQIRTFSSTDKIYW